MISKHHLQCTRVDYFFLNKIFRYLSKKKKKKKLIKHITYIFEGHNFHFPFQFICQKMHWRMESKTHDINLDAKDIKAHIPQACKHILKGNFM